MLDSHNQALNSIIGVELGSLIIVNCKFQTKLLLSGSFLPDLTRSASCPSALYRSKVSALRCRYSSRAPRSLPKTAPPTPGDCEHLGLCVRTGPICGRTFFGKPPMYAEVFGRKIVYVCAFGILTRCVLNSFAVSLLIPGKELTSLAGFS